MSRVTMADVAHASGVSSQTVSRVLNNKEAVAPETRVRVLEVMRQLGYKPSRVARGLATTHTRTLGFMVPNLVTEYYAEVVLGAQQTAWEAGYVIILVDTAETPAREPAVAGVMRELWVDGMICCSPRTPPADLVQLLGPNPIIFINNSQAGETTGSICTDDRYAMSLAVNHLLKLGRKTIGFLGGPGDSFSSQRRQDGFVAAIQAAGLEAKPELVMRRPDQLPNEAELRTEWWVEMGIPHGEHLARELLRRRPDVDGLICFNDTTAVGALRALAALGRYVPADIAVLGCDDIALARYVTPSLSTLSVSKYEMGASAARMLIGKIEGRGELSQRVFRHRLVARDSAPEPGS